MGEWEHERRNILFAVLKNPTPLRIREQINPCECVIGEYLMLDFAIVVPEKVSEKKMDRYEKHIVDNLTEAAKVALGTFNAYRRNLRFFPDRSVDSAYVAELRVYKQGFPHTREYDLPVNFPKSNNTNGY